MNETEKLRVKICLLGDPAVGKTSLIRRFVVNKFDDKYIKTVGTKVCKKCVQISCQDQPEIDCTFLIWDILGHKKYRELHSAFYQGAHGALIVCDVTHKDSLESVDGWVTSIFKTNGPIPLILLANKNDLKDQAAFTVEDLKTTAEEFEAPNYFTSAKTGENVETVFYRLGELMIENAGGF